MAIPEQPQPIVDTRDFTGMITVLHPTLLPPGAAAEQVNCYAIDRGRLQCRAGMKTVTFDASSTVS